jgi:hypothetical protein
MEKWRFVAVVGKMDGEVNVDAEIWENEGREMPVLFPRVWVWG